MNQTNKRERVVIIGGGFGGLNVAKALRGKPIDVTLVDKRNFHLFQPLLYQVATGGLSPGDIAYPLRSVLANAPNVTVLAAEVVDILPTTQRVVFKEGELPYDTLIVATGTTNHYFGHPEWERIAPGLKSVEEAILMRRNILRAFEAAEREPDISRQRAWLTFVIVGGGPTGVELAGAIAGLAQETMVGEFRHIDPRTADILLLEGGERILNTFPEDLSRQAEKALARQGVRLLTSTLLTHIDQESVHLRHVTSGVETSVTTHTVLWAAGTKASPIGQLLRERAAAQLDGMGRVIVTPDLSLPHYANIFVIGDLAHYAHQTGTPLPGVAQVAMQQGVYVAKQLISRRQGKDLPPFQYKDKGIMAVIGRHAAVADLGSWHLHGAFAWFMWLFVHISFLVGFDSKVRVLIQWAWSYFTRKRGARLITGENPTSD